jgi:hypothetical protein
MNINHGRFPYPRHSFRRENGVKHEIPLCFHQQIGNSPRAEEL